MANIIILGPAYPLRGGGMATFNERLAREFMSLGHQVCIYTFSLQYPGFLFPGKTQYSVEPPPVDLDIKVRINSINPLNWVKVGRELKDLKPDLLVVRYWMPFMAPSLGSIAAIVKKNNHTRVVAIADNITPHERKPGDTLFTKFFVKRVHSFLVMSQAVKKDLLRYTVDPDNISECLHPLYDNYGQALSQQQARVFLNMSSKESVVLFFGFIRHYKGLDLLIKAFSHERLKNKPIKLLVAGEFYTEAKPYFQLVKKLKLEDKVIWYNQFISNDMVRYYFCASDLVAQPYRDATQSGVTQIAYHFEIPMLVTRVGGLPEMVPHMKAGYVVDPNHHAIAIAIADYFDNEKKEVLTKGLIEEKKRFSWEKLANVLLQNVPETNN